MYKKVSYFDHIYQNKFDSIFFIDNEFNKKFLENLFVRVHLNKYAKIYYLKNILDKDNFYFYKKIILTNFLDFIRYK